VPPRQGAHLLHHDAALQARVGGDLPQRRGERTAHHLGAGQLVVPRVQLLERVLGGLQQGHATGGLRLLDGDDALGRW